MRVPPDQTQGSEPARRAQARGEPIECAKACPPARGVSAPKNPSGAQGKIFEKNHFASRIHIEKISMWVRDAKWFLGGPRSHARAPRITQVPALRRDRGLDGGPAAHEGDVHRVGPSRATWPSFLAENPDYQRPERGPLYGPTLGVLCCEGWRQEQAHHPERSGIRPSRLTAEGTMRLEFPAAVV
jgi:hypothetical protein